MRYNEPLSPYLCREEPEEEIGVVFLVDGEETRVAVNTMVPQPDATQPSRLLWIELSILSDSYIKRTGKYTTLFLKSKFTVQVWF